MKKLTLASLFVLLAPMLAFAQQYTLGQTTLSAKVGAGDTQIQLASITGINGYTANLQPIPSVGTTLQTNLYVDREEMLVLSIRGNVVNVRRGVNGTTGTAHASGQMVLSGPAVAFYTFDPGGTPGSPGGGVSGVACTAANTVATPWLNVRTGAQWLCSTVTGTWVPGFNNGAQAANTTLVADAAGTVTPSGPLFEMGGGTNAVTGFVIPVGCNATAVGGCQFTVIPTTGWTWTTAVNIATSGTAVANLAITFRWDAHTSKFIVQQSK